MNKNRLPALTLGLLCVVYLIFIAGSFSLLPERVAAHFGGDGQPNGWMPRVFYLRYHGYRKFFPLWALARYRTMKASGSVRVPFGM